MQVEKIQSAIEAAETFIRRANEVLVQAREAKFLLCDGKHAKILKKQSTKVIQAMQEMRRI